MRTMRQFFIADRAPIAAGIPVPLDVVRRLFSRKPLDASGCWHFAAQLTGPASNYSQLPWRTAEGRKVAIAVHRLSFIWHHGPIPEGKMVLHRCNAKGCFNPAHLYAGDDFDNARDRMDWEAAEAAAGRVTPSARMWARTAAAARYRPALACEAVAA